MRKYFMLFLLIGPCLYGQTYKHYIDSLTKAQREFRDYRLGITAHRNDSLLLKTEPIFDMISYDGDFIIGQISLIGFDYSKSLSFTRNKIWLCFDKSFNLQFAFPIGTEIAAFDTCNNVFHYSTLISTERDKWFNHGMVDTKGNILCHARGFNRSFIRHGIIISVYREINIDKETDTETKWFEVTFSPINKKSPSIRFLLKAPLLLGNYCLYRNEGITFYHIDYPDSLSQEEVYFSKAIDALLRAEDLSKVAEMFQKTANSSNRRLAECSAFNAEAITKKFLVNSSSNDQNSGHFKRD